MRCNHEQLIVDSYGVKRLYETRFMLALETSNSNEFNAFIVCAYIILNNPEINETIMGFNERDGNFIYAILSGVVAGIKHP